MMSVCMDFVAETVRARDLKPSREVLEYAQAGFKIPRKFKIQNVFFFFFFSNNNFSKKLLKLFGKFPK